MGKRLRALRSVVGVALVAGGAACGPYLDGLDDGSGTGGSGGGLCFRDEDCAPNGCCGQGTGAVVADQAPDCSAVRCSNSCPVTQLSCGCGLPVCRNGQCAVAITSGPGCP